jgi:hypothetical protein
MKRENNKMKLCLFLVIKMKLCIKRMYSIFLS